LGEYWKQKTPDTNSDIIILSVGFVFTLIIVGVFYIGKLDKYEYEDNYKMLEIDKGKQCSGGAYMYQGDSPRAKMCQEMANTPEGRCQIGASNCPNAYNGRPKVPIEFSSNSDSNWNGIPCQDKPPYMPLQKPKDNSSNCKCSLCSMSTDNC
jgi:hypothetical protein